MFTFIANLHTMKKLRLLALLASLSLLQSCWLFNFEDDPIAEPQTIYEPVYATRAELVDIKVQNPKPTTKNAKIYLKDQFIFVNDSRDGFHIVDNSDPANPKKLKYLKALGSTDVAIRNNILYLNQATDLVALKINTSTNEVQVLKRIENVFPAIQSPDGFDGAPMTDKIIVDWKLK